MCLDDGARGPIERERTQTDTCVVERVTDTRVSGFPVRSVQCAPESTNRALSITPAKMFAYLILCEGEKVIRECVAESGAAAAAIALMMYEWNYSDHHRRINTFNSNTNVVSSLCFFLFVLRNGTRWSGVFDGLLKYRRRTQVQ